jgi:glycosyltransferase involved in cell wall biosynthesis
MLPCLRDFAKAVTISVPHGNLDFTPMALPQENLLYRAESDGERNGRVGIPYKITAFATQGVGHSDERRIATLVSSPGFSLFPFDRNAKLKSAIRLLRAVRRGRPDLLVMEGTGSAGGAALLVARLFLRTPYVFGSGDAVSPFLSARLRVLRPLFALYERLLCRLSAGFIGWTPYLTGRALTFGAPRAMTAPGWSDLPTPGPQARERTRDRLGIPPDAVVFGIVGSLQWDRRRRYCYGHELVRAASTVDRPDLRVLVVGDGTGLPHLKRLAEKCSNSAVLFTGRVGHQQVPDLLSAIDVASLPQSVDGVGSFRYTIKLSEYLAANLPIVTGQIPLAYDLDAGWLWRLPGSAPWDPRYVAALASLMSTLTPHDIDLRRQSVPAHTDIFDKDLQVRRVAEFVLDVLEAHSN